MSLKERQKILSLIPHNPLHIKSNIDLLTLLKIKTGYKSAKSLQSQGAYTLHALLSHRFHCRPTIVSGPGVQLQADRMDVSSHSRHNENVNFFLIVADVFSRLA